MANSHSSRCRLAARLDSGVARVRDFRELPRWILVIAGVVRGLLQRNGALLLHGSRATFPRF